MQWSSPRAAQVDGRMRVRNGAAAVAAVLVLGLSGGADAVEIQPLMQFWSTETVALEQICDPPFGCSVFDPPDIVVSESVQPSETIDVAGSTVDRFGSSAHRYALSSSFEPHGFAASGEVEATGANKVTLGWSHTFSVDVAAQIRISGSLSMDSFTEFVEGYGATSQLSFCRRMATGSSCAATQAFERIDFTRLATRRSDETILFDALVDLDPGERYRLSVELEPIGTPSDARFEVTATIVPEPSTALLLALGLTLLASRTRRA